MILGIAGVVRVQDANVGQFYLEPVYGAEPRLFQCVNTGKIVDGESVNQALYFFPGEEMSIALEDFPFYNPVVAMPNVHVRVDPPSISGSSNMSTISAGQFLVVGNEPIVTAREGFRHWRMMNLDTGKPAEGPTGSWVSFSRWLLVVEENGEEIPIASFGA
jgi:hypothetical protein